MLGGDVQNLIKRCIKRDRKAWEQFIERFSGLLYFSAAERLKRNGIFFGQQDLEDIVQGVLLDLWEKRRLEEVRERNKISGWLSIIAQNRALNHMVRKKERLLSEDNLFKLDNLKADIFGPAEEDRADLIERLFEELKPREKIILRMNIVYDKKHREIAGFMKLPVSTVSTIIARRKGYLKKKLKNFERKSGA
jgi:RNA polymerase sigma factor (sigma-70 family)